MAPPVSPRRVEAPQEREISSKAQEKVLIPKRTMCLPQARSHNHPTPSALAGAAYHIAEKHAKAIQYTAIRIISAVRTHPRRNMPPEPDANHHLFPAFRPGRRVQPKSSSAHVHRAWMWTPVLVDVLDLLLRKAVDVSVPVVPKRSAKLSLQPCRNPSPPPRALPVCVGIKALISPRTQCSRTESSSSSRLSAPQCMPPHITLTPRTSGWRPRTAPYCCRSYCSRLPSSSSDTLQGW